MPRTKSEIWDSFVVFKRNGKIYGKCKFCGKLYLSNATKMGYHLLKCNACPDERKVEIRNNRKTFQTFHLGKSGIVDSVDTSENTSNSSYPRTSRSSVGTKLKEEDNYINEALARALCNSSLPFCLVENRFFNNFLKILQPVYNVPSKDKLASVLLNEEFRKVKHFVDMQFENATSLTLVTSGWNTDHIEILFATPKLVFLRSFSSDSDKHTPEYISSNLSKQIDEVGPSRISGILTSYHENMDVALEEIQRKYSQVVVYGCIVDSLNLFSNDIIKINLIQTVISKAGYIVKYLSGIKYLALEVSKDNIFIELQNREVGDAFAILEAIIKRKLQLQRELTNLEGNIDDNLKNLILKNEKFWDVAHECSTLLATIADMIYKVKNEKPALEYVYSYFVSLKSKICLTETKSEILKCFHKRKLFFNWGCILTANFLNPKLHTSNMSEEDVTTAMEFIIDLGIRLDIDEVDLLAELAEYKVKDGDWHVSKSAWKVSEKINPSTWWKCFFATKNITKVACRLLNMPSVACHYVNHIRNHTNRCHSLCSSDSNKYEFIRHNENLMSEEDFKHSVLIENEDVELILQTQQEMNDLGRSKQIREEIDDDVCYTLEENVDELDAEDLEIKQETSESFIHVEEG